MSFKRDLLTWSILALASLMLVACGGSDNESSAPVQNADAPPAAEQRSQPEPEPESEAEPAADPASAAQESDSMASDTSSQAEPGMSMGEQDAGSADAAAAPDNRLPVDDDGVARLTIGSTDTMQYTVRFFTVEAGQDIELTLVHEGSLPVDVMGHNVAILPIGGDYVAFSRQVMSEGGSVDNDYLPESMREGLVAYTQLIGGGESDTITFTAPDEPGEYPFLCTFPGHFGVMNGIMTVL